MQLGQAEINNFITTMLTARVYVGKRGEGGGGGGVETFPDFKLRLLCVQAATAKGRPKIIVIEKQERNKQLSSHVTHTKIKA